MIFFTFDMEKDESKAEKVYYKYRNLMYKIAFDILKNRESAEDAVIYSMEKIIRNIKKVGDVESNKTKNFVAIICRNVALDMYDKRKKDYMAEESYYESCKEAAEKQYNPESIALNKDDIERVEQAIEELEPIYRDVFLLRYSKNMKREEIAALLNINPETVKKRLTRAKDKILKKIQRG